MLVTKKLVGFGVRHASTWQVFGGAILERRAVVVKKFTPMERAYCDLLSQIEDESSLLSDFELRDRQEKKSRQKKTEGAGLVKVELAEDLLLKWKAEAAEIKSKLAHTPVTDSKSLDRCLDEPITLLVKQKLGKESLWMFPQAANEGEETIRDTAVRALSNTIGENLQMVPLGNAPVAHYHYRYPSDVKQSTGFEGAKIFFFKIQYKTGQVDLKNKLVEDHMWATYDELAENVPKKIWKAVKPSIFVPPSVDFTPYLEEVDAKEEIERLSLASKSA